ncbi:MAG TPA: helical backbone metal receptor [Egibacteraceae bacterium]|nr:helical backbone metal receptor [Egibacteraceae bacterium]
MRVISLVPSTTEIVAAVGRAPWLVGVTSYCTVGAPPTAAVVGGTKNPDLARIVALRPDVVLANTEENRPADLDTLREQGLNVHETFPRTVEQARDVLCEIADVLEAAEQAAPIADDITGALAEAEAAAPDRRVVALTLIWRKPWMGLGPDTYADDLLWRCGFANALSGYPDRYPRLDEGLHFGADVVLLPSEPYEFGAKDLPALGALAGDTPARFVDGELLTWHGPRTADGLRTFSRLAEELAAG